MLGSTVLGVLEFTSPRLREPDEDLAGTLGVIASQFAQFIERKRSEEALRHQALHDALTGLPNRTLFHDRVSQALEHARRDGPSARRPGHGPRLVQGRQRHPRPPVRRHPAPAGWRAAFWTASAPATPSHGSAATSSGSCSPTRTAPARPSSSSGFRTRWPDPFVVQDSTPPGGGERGSRALSRPRRGRRPAHTARGRGDVRQPSAAGPAAPFTRGARTAERDASALGR